MLGVLLDFCAALRAAGLALSVEESIAAARTLGQLGLSSRTRLHDSLAALCCKNVRELRLFEECFARFFSTQGLSGGLSTRERSAAELRTLRQLERAAREVALDDMQLALQRPYFRARMLEHLAPQAPAASAVASVALGDGQQQARVGAYVERRFALVGRHRARRARERSLMELRLSRVERQLLPEMYVLVQRMAARLRRRRMNSPRLGVRHWLDPVATLRRNLRHDGVPFVLRYRMRAKKPRRLFVLCDLSPSMQGHARFFLLLAYALRARLPHTRMFAFSSTAGEITALFRSAPPAQAVQRALHLLGGGATDYGAALETLQERCAAQLDRDSSIFILGDARSDSHPAHQRLLRHWFRRCRRVIWLNPEERSLWGAGDSKMLRYQPYCHWTRVCRSLGDLEAAFTAFLEDESL